MLYIHNFSKTPFASRNDFLIISDKPSDILSLMFLITDCSFVATIPDISLDEARYKLKYRNYTIVMDCTDFIVVNNISLDRKSYEKFRHTIQNYPIVSNMVISNSSLCYPISKDIIIEIFLYLSPEVIYNRCMKSKYLFYHIYDNDFFWKRYLCAHHPNYNTINNTNYRVQYFKLNSGLKYSPLSLYSDTLNKLKYHKKHYGIKLEDYSVSLIMDSCIYECIDVLINVFWNHSRKYRVCNEILKRGLYDISMRLLNRLKPCAHRQNKYQKMLECAIIGGNIIIVKYLVERFKVNVKSIHLDLVQNNQYKKPIYDYLKNILYEQTYGIL